MQYYPPESHDYFFGRLTRNECEPILQRNGCTNGLYLLREKLEEPGSYVLSICFDNKIHHYKFERTRDKTIKIGSSKQFIGPIELVNYLEGNNVGLLTNPKIKCKRFAKAEPIYYLFVDTRNYLDAVEKQIRLKHKGEEATDAKGRLRYVYEKAALKDLHSTQRWYRRNTNQELAEELFKENGLDDGKFLLRSSLFNKYKLSVCYQNSINHYRIVFTDGKYSIEGSVGEEFDYLVQLIDFYGRQEGHLKCLLKMPYDVNKKQKEIYYCDTNNYYKAFITNNETLIESGALFQNVSTFKDLVFGLPNATLLGKLGEGNFSKVYKAKYKPSGFQQEICVAIKVLNQKNEQLNNSVREANTMKVFSHPNILKVLEVPVVFDEELKNSVIILEYADIGPINKYLRENSSMPIKNLLLISEQIASALSYITEANIIHRDIAARNVLLFSPILAKISDFGLARKMDDSHYYNSKHNDFVPVKWYPPEVLESKKYSEKSDVWSFGILLWEMFSYGGTPFGIRRVSNNKELDSFVRDIKCGNLTLEKPEKCSDEIYKIMKSCWNIDYKLRPSFKQLLDSIQSFIIQYNTYDTPL